MKKLAILIVALALPVLSWGQDYNSDMAQADSVVYRQAAAMDSTLVGKSIFGLLSSHPYGEGDVKIHQSQSIVNAMKLQIASNSSRRLTGYRVRIFFDNSKTARNASENVMKIFKATIQEFPHTEITRIRFSELSWVISGQSQKRWSSCRRSNPHTRRLLW